MKMQGVLRKVDFPEAGRLGPDQELIPVGGSSKRLQALSLGPPPTPHWAGPRARWGSTRNTLARGLALLRGHKYLGPDARPPRAACRLPPAPPAQLQGAWELRAGVGQAQIRVLERSLTAVGRRSSLWYFSSCGQSLGRWKHSADLLKASSRVHGV